MALPAFLGITNGAVALVVKLLLLFLVVFWIALVYWTYADARRRIADPMLVGCATAASLFPFAGTLVYLIVRPPEYLEDVRERELEIAAAEARLAGIEQHVCPHCRGEVERSFLRCPNCTRRLKQPCRTCGKPLNPRWRICPYCEGEVSKAQPQRARRERTERPRERPPVARPGGVMAAPVDPAAAKQRASARDAAVARQPASSRAAAAAEQRPPSSRAAAATEQQPASPRAAAATERQPPPPRAAGPNAKDKQQPQEARAKGQQGPRRPRPADGAPPPSAERPDGAEGTRRPTRQRTRP